MKTKKKYDYEPLWLKPATKKRYDKLMINWTKYLNIRSNDVLMNMLLEMAEKKDSIDVIQVGRKLAFEELEVME